jgi:hypothetical protein
MNRRLYAYWALMTVADHIEAHPDRYNYLTSVVPETINDYGCVLAWLCFFTRRKYTPRPTPFAPSKVIGMEDFEFYSMMNIIDFKWRICPERCVSALRLCAEQWFGPDKIPAWALALNYARAKASKFTLCRRREDHRWERVENNDPTHLKCVFCDEELTINALL